MRRPRWSSPALVTVTLLAPLLAMSSYAGTSIAAAPHSPSHSPSRVAERGVKHVPVPRAGSAVDTSHPDHVVGNGTPASCTSHRVVRAVAKGGVITFACGPDPVVIAMRHTARVITHHGDRKVRRVVIDGGGLVTLSGMDKRRVLVQNTCAPQSQWTTDHCNDQRFPQLVVQNLTLVHGNARGHGIDSGSGGAMYVRGGRLKIVHSRFLDNRCYRVGPDLGGAAVRALDQFHDGPVYVVGSTFRGGRCSNGSALSSIGVSWTVLNSRFEHNRAIGHGANPADSGTPGGGSGGAIYTDGDDYTLRVAGTLIRHNHANEGGGAIFYVSNDRSGRLHLRWSTLRHNVSAGFETRPGIFYLGRGAIDARHSIIR